MIPSVLVSCPDSSAPRPRLAQGLTFIGQTGVLIRSSVGIGRRSVTLLLPVLSISPHYSRYCCKLTNVGGRGPRLADGRY